MIIITKCLSGSVFFFNFFFGRSNTVVRQGQLFFYTYNTRKDKIIRTWGGRRRRFQSIECDVLLYRYRYYSTRLYPSFRGVMGASNIPNPPTEIFPNYIYYVAGGNNLFRSLELSNKYRWFTSNKS